MLSKTRDNKIPSYKNAKGRATIPPPTIDDNIDRTPPDNDSP